MTPDPGAAGSATRATPDGEAVVLDVTGSFPSAAAVGNAAMLRALSRDPAVVVCDLSRVTGDLDEAALGQLLDTGGLLQHWSGTAVVLVTPRPLDDTALARHGDGSGSGITAVAPIRGLATAEQATGRGSPGRPRAEIHVDQHPRAGRLARDFVTRTCLDWQLPQAIGSSVLVVSELVTNGLVHAGTALDVAMSTAGGRLLLSVRDGSGELPRAPEPRSGPARTRGLTLVAGFSRAWGSLPRAGGGKVVWAVVDT